MKIFDKSMKLEHVAYDIRGPVLEEADRMRANGEKILRLNTGNPAAFGFEAPDEVIRDLITNARESEGYSDSKGIFSARKAVMQYYQLQNIHVDMDDIYIVNGVSEGISMSMQALLDNDDEVLVPMPDYPLWT
ncbi:TPA: aminotransferase class I/II-fold pyridoxal phosphate-dependent enzyme, partial [Streptococcus agalactiae]